MSSSHGLDRIAVTFDDDHTVATAGLLLTSKLGEHPGLEAVIDDCVDLGVAPVLPSGARRDDPGGLDDRRRRLHRRR